MNSPLLLDTLWQISWQSALFALVIWGLTRLLPRMPARWHYALWLLVLVKFFVPPVLTLPTVPLATQQATAAHISETSPISSPQAALTAPTPIESAGIAAGVEAAQPYTAPLASGTPPIPVAADTLLLWGWLAGMAIMAVLLLIWLIRLGLLLRSAHPADDRIQQLLTEAGIALGLRKVPMLRVSPKVPVPMVAWLGRPTILLPEDVQDRCCMADIRVMLLHELGHVQRWDLTALWLQQLVQVVFFFHPLAWLAGREVARWREFACDAWVLERTAMPPQQYAAGYVAALKLLTGGTRPASALAMAEPATVEQRRVQAMLQFHRAVGPQRWAVVVLLAAILGLPTFLGCARPLTGTGLAKSAWPKDGGDIQHTGRCAVTPLLGKIAWSHRFRYRKADTRNHKSKSTIVPVEFRNPAIVGKDNTVYFSSCRGVVYAIDGASGRRKWTRDVVDEEFYRKSHSSGKLSLKDSVLSTAHHLKWHRNEEIYPDINACDTPVLGANGLLYIGSADGRLYALDARTGRTRWMFTKVTASYGGIHGLNISKTGILYASAHEWIFAVDGNTGELLWERQSKTAFPLNIRGAPAIGHDGTVYANAGDELLAYDPRTGDERWQLTGEFSSIKGHSVGADDTVYIGTRDGKVIAVDGARGNVKWQATLPATHMINGKVYPEHIYQAISIDTNGTLYLSTSRLNVYALDGRTGKMLWSNTKSRMAGPIIVAPNHTLLVTNYVYHPTTGVVSSLTTLDGRTGKELHRVPLAKISQLGCSPPAIGPDGTVYISAGERGICAVR